MAEYKPEREYRAMQTFRALPTTEENPESKKVRGYFTTFNEPYLLWEFSEPGYKYEFWEEVDRNAFDNCDTSDVIFVFNHEGHVYARTKNKTLDILPADDHGKPMEAELGTTSGARAMYEEINTGLIDEMSFCFKIGDQKRETEELEQEDGSIIYKVKRTILTIPKLYDVSPVSRPANPGTDIGVLQLSARKFGDGVIEEIRAERLAATELRTARARLALKIKLLEVTT